MIGLGVDAAWSPPTAEQMIAGGYTYSLRYLSPDKTKNLTKTELDDNIGHGLGQIVVWEWTAGRALQGYQAGYDDALRCTEQANDLGLPNTLLIAFACDEDVSAPLTDAYYAGVSEGRSGASGVYGPRAVGERQLWYGRARMFWQWGPGSVHIGTSANADILQRTFDIRVGHIPGVPDSHTDENVILRDGLFIYRGTPHVADPITVAALAQERAVFERLCSEAYDRGDMDGAGRFWRLACAVAAEQLVRG